MGNVIEDQFFKKIFTVQLLLDWTWILQKQDRIVDKWMSQTVYGAISQTTSDSHSVDRVSSAFLLKLFESKNLGTACQSTWAMYN